MTILITGGAGFIGSHFAHYMLRSHPDVSVVNVDALTYAGNLSNIRDLDGNLRHMFIRGDIRDRGMVERICREHGVSAVVNFAAETHVDRSIQSGVEFIRTDVEGVYALLCVVRDLGIPRMVHVSTDEVYGDIPVGTFSKETDMLRPSSSYAASKAGGELQCFAFHRTFDTPVMITRAANTYGPNMYPEKIIPLFITNLLEEKKVPVYGDGAQVRDWLYVEDHCRGVDTVLQKGRHGEAYNIGANQYPEITNLALARKLLALLGKDASSIEFVKDRPGHDRRYAMDTTKIRETLGWAPEVSFDEGILRTVEWYRKNTSWWEPIKRGEYAQWYKKQYRN